VCNNEACEYDRGDCASTPTGAPVKVCSCPLLWLGDKDCNEECNTPECNFDNGDCASTLVPSVPVVQLTQAPAALPVDVTYDTPAPATNVAAKQCAPGCTAKMLGDKKCDFLCNSAACIYDDGDCEPSAYQCAPGCFLSMRNDSMCDSACNVKDCQFDNNDCRAAVDPMQVPSCLKV
jgi:Notch-like protein